MQVFQEKRKKSVKPGLAGQLKSCPKCSYVRKASDSSPKWQCPNCKVAYKKVSDEHLRQSQREYEINQAKSAEKRKAKSRFRGILTLGVTWIGLGVVVTCTAMLIAGILTVGLSALFS